MCGRGGSHFNEYDDNEEVNDKDEVDINEIEANL